MVDRVVGDVMQLLLCFFFFQAEDGIRDHCVTGVQTCALPILTSSWSSTKISCWPRCAVRRRISRPSRSEERRVGKECRSRWAPDQEEKKQRHGTVDRRSAEEGSAK